MDSGEVFYSKQDHTYILKFVGDIRYTMGSSLDDFLDRLFTRNDFDNILIDLTETTAIDSTNLGLLAKIANFMRARLGKKTTLVSVNSDINQILDSVGFYEVFSICKDQQSCLVAAQRLAIANPSDSKLAETLFEAHKILSELNPENREEFKSVVQVLKTKLADKD